MRERVTLPGDETRKIKRTVRKMLGKAKDLGVTHVEQEMGLQPRNYAKRSLFPTMDADLDRYETEKTFWITGIIKEDILKAAKAYLFNYAKEHPEAAEGGKGFEEGLYETLREWLPVKDANGRTINTAARSEVIARTNIMDIYNHARLSMLRQPELKAWVQGYRFSAILDSVTTPICRHLHGKIFTPDSLNGYNPPLHFNALAEGTLIRTRVGMVPIESVLPGTEVWTHRGRWRRVYAQMGKSADKNRVRVLLLASGRRVRITDEHPVLCALPRGGWKFARNLQAGDVLFEYSEDMSRVPDHPAIHPEDFPSLFDEPGSTWSIMRLSASAPMVLPIDLQNDASLQKGEVGDVSPDRMLKNEIGTGSHEVPVHDRLVGFGVCPIGFRSADGRLIHNTGHVDGIEGLHPTRMGRMNGTIALAEAPSPMILSAGSLSVGAAVRNAGLLDAITDGNSVTLAPGREHGLPDAEFALDEPQRFSVTPVTLVDDNADNDRIREVGFHDSPPGWTLSTIISTVDEEYKGNVWNLAVEEDETYLAENVIVHNCRSVLLPVTLLDEGWKREMLAQGPITVTPQDGFASGVDNPPPIQEAAMGKAKQ